MMTALLILLALVLAGALVFFLMKTGKIEDKDGNNIPDVIDQKVEAVNEVIVEVKEKVEVVKQRAKRVKEETVDVIEAAKEVLNQAKDITKAAGGSARRGAKKKTK